jgi:hypothetical protein
LEGAPVADTCTQTKTRGLPPAKTRTGPTVQRLRRQLSLLLWLRIPSGFLVVFEKPNRRSFSLYIYAPPRLPAGEWHRGLNSGQGGEGSRGAPCPVAALEHSHTEGGEEGTLSRLRTGPWHCHGSGGRLLTSDLGAPAAAYSPRVNARSDARFPSNNHPSVAAPTAG